MRRHNSLVPISQDHRDFLLLAHPIKKGGPAYNGIPENIEDQRLYAIEFFRQRIAPHISIEEDILFQAIKGYNKQIDDLIISIKTEHIQIRKLIEMLDSNNDIESTLDKLGNLLDKYIRKEERTLFQLVQEHIPEDILRELAPLIKSEKEKIEKICTI